MIMEFQVRDFARVGKILSSDTTSLLSVYTDDAANPENMILGQFTADINAPTLKYLKGRGTVAAPADVVSGDRVMEAQGFGYSGGTFFNNANVRSYIDAAVVSGQAPAQRLEFETGAANATPSLRMVIKSSGLVGIGAFNPGASVDPQAILHTATASGVTGLLEYDADDAEGSRLVLRKARGTLAAPTAVVNADRVFQIYADMQSNAGIGNTLRGSSIESYVRAAVVAGQRPATDLEFYTNVNNSVPALAMYINTDGKVGVGNSFVPGTTDATEILHSRTAGTNTLVWGLMIQNPNNTNNNATGIGMIFSADSNNGLAKGGIAYIRDASDWGRGRLLVMQNTAASNTKPTATDVVMQIENNGNVGIGKLWTSSNVPSYPLHLQANGNAYQQAIIEGAETSATPGRILSFYTSRGTVTARTNVTLDDQVGYFNWYAYSNSYFENARLKAYVDDTVVAGQAPAMRLEFHTGPANGVPVVNVAIRSNGFLTVGTEVCLLPLASVGSHMFGAEGSAKHLRLRRADTTNGFNLYFDRSRGTIASPSNVVDADRMARIEAYAYSGATGFWATGRMDIEVEGAVVDNQRPGSRFVWYTNIPNGAVTERMRLLSTGKFGIGVTPDSDKLLHVEISQTATSFVKFRNTANASNAHGIMIQAGSNTTAGSDFAAWFRPDGTFIGSINQNAATTVAYNTSSDRRLKENIVDAAPALKRIQAMQVREFNFKGDAQTLTGFIAQELHEVYPEAVSPGTGSESCACCLGEKDLVGKDIVEHKEGCFHRRPWAVDYSKLTPLLVKAVQELYALLKP